MFWWRGRAQLPNLKAQISKNIQLTIIKRSEFARFVKFWR